MNNRLAGSPEANAIRIVASAHRLSALVELVKSQECQQLQYDLEEEAIADINAGRADAEREYGTPDLVLARRLIADAKDALVLPTVVVWGQDDEEDDDDTDTSLEVNAQRPG